MQFYRPPRLTDTEPRTVNWYMQNGVVYRREWNPDAECYNEPRPVRLIDMILALQYYETREHNVPAHRTPGARTTKEV